MGKYSGSFFNFSKSERNGIVVLLILIGVLLFIDVSISRLKEESSWDYSQFEEEITAFENSIAEAGEINEKSSDNKTKKKTKTNNQKVPRLFYFDPNSASVQEWKKLGLEDYQINIIKNYLKEGGKFYKPVDLKKIYGLEEKTYNRLKDYIRIENNNKPEHQESKVLVQENKAEESTENFAKIDLNTADTVQLRLIHGIGEVYAQRICKYRELLRGYQEIAQLNEVYGINDSIYNKISKYFKVDSSQIQKIDINTADFPELIRHPYLNKFQTKSILKYREIKGEIKDITELRKYNILPSETYNKMRGYITCK